MEGGKRSKALRKFTKLVNVKLLGTEYSHWVNASNFGTSVFQGIKDGRRGYIEKAAMGYLTIAPVHMGLIQKIRL